MKIIDEEKINIDSAVKKLCNSIELVLPNSFELSYAKDLVTDIENDFYTVVVVGEFKRGKSTFINALLGEKILPVDVTPTTATINAIMWNEEKTLEVHKADGQVEQLELKYENLTKYVADRKIDHSSIKYIKIGMPSNMLKNNIVLVDTPGVDDLNEQRVDVTNNFIPRADVVIFLLDSTNAIRRTEKEFLENNILKEGIKKIIFVANFIDEIDEDEDIEEIIDDISNRIRNIIKSGPIDVLALSAREALDGLISNDNEKIKNSGILEVRSTINNIIEHGTQSNEKLKRYKTRTLNILNSVEKEINTLSKLEKQTTEELNRQLENIKVLMDNEMKRKKEIRNYVSKQQEEMLAIVNKSIYYFTEDLKTDALYQFDEYKGGDFKDFIEKHLPRKIERQFKMWIRQYEGYINKMFKMLENELASGMARHFNTTINKFNINKVDDISNTDIGMISIDAEDISKTGIIAGALAGGTAVILSLLGGGFFLPLIGMAGMPFLGKKMMDNKLEEVKMNLRPEIEKSIDESVDKFVVSMRDYVINNTNNIAKSCENRYEEILMSIKCKIEEEINNKKDLKNKSEDRYKNLSKFQNEIKEYKILVEE